MGREEGQRSNQLSPFQQSQNETQAQQNTSQAPTNSGVQEGPIHTEANQAVIPHNGNNLGNQGQGEDEAIEEMPYENQEIECKIET
ncbi:hypothetical protein COLO4_30018 [Corchorus olitorius]|uniref:Uncharacterized protein n=1 Tax=Corchorus olitorius TaxID=93759 RepID=A0A1R3HBL0_9ROSI|nr:hypothetical protein COLO4_30018 [Corchorus olitorius]